MSPGEPGAGAMLPDACTHLARPADVTSGPTTARRAQVPGTGACAAEADSEAGTMPHRLTPTIATVTTFAALTLVGPIAAGDPPTDRPPSSARADAASPDEVTSDPGGATSDPGGSDYRAPTVGSVLRLFDPPAHRWSPGHRGVDLACDDGIVGAPGGGVISFSGTVVDRGVVTITHADGLRTSLEPVADAPPAGTTVRAGDPVGVVESVGHCRRACVHWGVRRGETYLDPLSLLGREPVVLLPVP